MSRIIGIDPGLATCGLAVVDLTPTGYRLLRLDVFASKPSPKKQSVLAASDTLRRARELADWLSPWINGASAVAAERFSAPRNASSAAKIGWAWGVIAALAEAEHMPVIQPSPQEVHKTLCGSASASKLDVEQACRERLVNDGPHNGEAAIGDLNARLARGLHEHAWDAFAVVLASLDSDLARAIRPRGTSVATGVRL
jgi:Holliday junction resolvasome RuvABC endonuclease subunit